MFEVFGIRKYSVENGTTLSSYLPVKSQDELDTVLLEMAQMQVDLAFEIEEIELSLERVQKGIRNLVNHSELGFYLVATTTSESSGERIVVGMCGATFDWSDWRNGVFWWLNSVFVKKPYRRQGVFKLMYSQLMNRAKLINEVLEKSGSDELVTADASVPAAERFRCCGVRLYHEKENLTAKASYEKMGMSTAVYEMMEVDFVINRS
jgi:GNAT superfamily N-acetyltransferase